MSLRYWLYMGADTGLVDITDRLRKYTLDFEEKAEEGAVAVNTVILDDPDADLNVHGHRWFGVEETAAVSSNDRFVGVGFFGEARVIRGPYRTGVGRQWSVEVGDPNTFLNRFVMVGKDNDRPAETDVARVQWVEATTEGNSIDDTRYLDAVGPVNMDATNYLLQDFLSVLSDCSQQSGKNYFVTYFGDNVIDDNNPWGAWSLWYGFAASSNYQSTARLSNVASDIDDVTTFPLFEEDELLIDPMRIYSKVIVPYKGSYVVAENLNTAANYAHREVVMNAPNVSTKATATARANRYLQDLRTPEQLATVTTIVPRQYVNLIRPGMSVQVKATHWPEPYASTYTYMRCLSRRVVEVSEADEEAFELHLSLSRGEPIESAAVQGQLQYAGGPYAEPYANIVRFDKDGDPPHTGYGTYPTVGPLTALSGAYTNRPWWGWQFDGDGTVDYHVEFSVTGVRARATTYTVALQVIRVSDGSVIGSTSFTVPSDAAGGFASFASSGAPNRISLEDTGVAVTNGDQWYAQLTCSPAMPFFRTPAGTGAGYNNFEITGGTLA